MVETLIGLSIVIASLILVTVGQSLKKKNEQIERDYVEVVGVISSFERAHISLSPSDRRRGIKVIVKYYFNNQLYTVQSNFYSTTMKVGQEINLMVNPENPEKMVYKSSLKIAYYIVNGLGVFLFVLGTFATVLGILI